MTAYFLNKTPSKLVTMHVNYLYGSSHLMFAFVPPFFISPAIVVSDHISAVASVSIFSSAAGSSTSMASPAPA